MGLNPFNSENEEADEEVYIGEPVEKDEKNTEKDYSPNRQDREEGDDTLETELEEKLVGTKQKTEDSKEKSVSLEDVHDQNEEIIDLLERINNKL